MKESFLGLRTTIYKVNDIIKAKEWYSQVLGISPYFDESYYVGFNVGGYELGLQPEEQSSPFKSDNVVTYWGVSDIELSFYKLIAAGAVVHEQPEEVGEGIKTASVKDLWGNVVGIIENPHFALQPHTI
ncbi:VOC family protein [Cytophagaceae bacterium DM2B3-1]|uniref:VOC family protein n=1 Tax=Xanthocytophaga flava TaxID=3048013 RepID=A0ABT7CCQ4_9BACT|nr:VOC family protein [Xanthocytophaga flavus]MDJ1470678.1 VOC family protein [Xanthocytophaga flavus]MDJ1491479.1 VOC family protein [Xanthocytophaga flavus]